MGSWSTSIISSEELASKIMAAYCSANRIKNMTDTFEDIFNRYKIYELKQTVFEYFVEIFFRKFRGRELDDDEYSKIRSIILEFESTELGFLNFVGFCKDEGGTKMLAQALDCACKACVASSLRSVLSGSPLEDVF